MDTVYIDGTQIVLVGDVEENIFIEACEITRKKNACYNDIKNKKSKEDLQ